MFENRVLWRTSGPKRQEVTVGRKKLHNEVFHDLYSFPSILRVIKMIWIGQAALIGEMKNVKKFSWET
jgi:hypothetical protein